MGVPQKTKPNRPNNEANPTITNFILVVVTVLFVSLASLYWLQEDAAVQGQKYWLISRAAAIAAYVVMSLVILLGIVLSHPRNKDTWRWTPYLLPWHQALMGSMFGLIGVHIFFTVIDSKSGVSWGDVLFPADSKYHPVAMVLGAAGLYILILTSVTAALRKRLRLWLFIHRLSWLSWVCVFFHGLAGGTDTQLRPLYWVTGLILFSAFLSRHWMSVRYGKAVQKQEIVPKA